MTNKKKYCIILEVPISTSGGMVDTHALGACANRREGSSPFSCTKKKEEMIIRQVIISFFDIKRVAPEFPTALGSIFVISIEALLVLRNAS